LISGWLLRNEDGTRPPSAQVRDGTNLAAARLGSSTISVAHECAARTKTIAPLGAGVSDESKPVVCQEKATERGSWESTRQTPPLHTRAF